MDRAEAATAFVDRFIAEPFAWGIETDCAGRVCWYLDLIDRLPDDWRAGMEAPRTNQDEARFILKRLYRAATFARAVSGAFTPVAPLGALTGDLAGVPAPSERDPAVGVVLGPQIFVTGPTGLEPKPLTAACIAWRVPE